jgi:alpha-glucoside transport system substrate-binding protein
MKRPRTLLVTALFALACVPACASAGSAGTVTILASWSGAEEQSFRKVLADFEAKENIEVDYIGTRALGQVLQSEVQKGTPPDIAVMPSPGELATYARKGYLHELDEIVRQPADEYGSQWLELEKAATRNRYAVAVKADLKSVVWYNPARLAGPKPQTGAELVALTANAVAGGGTPWCMGMGATPDSGWPGTDWIEDILLHQSGPEVYRQWASGTLPWTSAPVRAAWTTWGQLAGPDAVRGGPNSALLTDFADSGRPLFAQPPGCLLHHQATFVMGTYQGFGAGVGRDFDYFPFPTFGDTPRAWEVSADLAAMFNDTPEARKLIDYLASERAQRIWPSDGTAFSVNRKVDRGVYADDVSRRIAETLTSDETLCFDASDLMPAAMRTVFYRAVLEYLNDPAQLDALLGKLDAVRGGVNAEEWLDFPCGG